MESQKESNEKARDFCIWELFLPGLREKELYKFAVQTANGKVHIKADPYAYQAEMRPQTASVVSRISRHVWRDQSWVEKRGRFQSASLNIYKLHIGSWKTKEGALRLIESLLPSLRMM